MRTWMSYLLNNPAAYADFIDWAVGCENELKQKISAAVRDDKIEDARGMSHEIVVYETLRKSLEVEKRELESQAQYDEQYT